MTTPAISPAYAELPWREPDRAEIDHGVDYLVECNDGAVEVWSGGLLLWRMRPEFQVGRAVRCAVLSWDEWERVQ